MLDAIAPVSHCSQQDVFTVKLLGNWAILGCLFRNDGKHDNRGVATTLGRLESGQLAPPHPNGHDVFSGWMEMIQGRQFGYAQKS